MPRRPLPQNKDTKYGVKPRFVDFHLIKKSPGRWESLLADKKLGAAFVKVRQSDAAAISTAAAASLQVLLLLLLPLPLLLCCFSFCCS